MWTRWKLPFGHLDGNYVEVWFHFLTNPNYGVFSFLVAPVPKSQKGQGPGPVSRARLQLRGLRGALTSTLLPASAQGLSRHQLVWDLLLLWRGLQPVHQPLPPRSLQRLHFLLGSAGVCARVGIPLHCTQAELELAGPCSLLTQLPPWPSMPLLAGRQSWPSFVGMRRNISHCGLKYHVRWTEGLPGWLCFPWWATAVLTNEICCQGWTRVYLPRDETLETLQISAQITESHVWWAQGLPNQMSCFPSAHVPVYLWPGDLQGLVIDRKDSCTLFFVSIGFLCLTRGLSCLSLIPCPHSTRWALVRVRSAHPSGILCGRSSQHWEGSTLL